jgi:hypothetical protein
VHLCQGVYLSTYECVYVAVVHVCCSSACVSEYVRGSLQLRVACIA